VIDEIAHHTLAFCRERVDGREPEFHLNTLQQYIQTRVYGASAQSAGQALEQLMEQSTITCQVLSRDAALYRIVMPDDGDQGRQYERLARYYTPNKLADVITRQLPIRPGHHILEGHIGSGAWGRAVQRLACMGVPTSLEVNDLDKEAPGLKRSLYRQLICAFDAWDSMDACPYDPFLAHTGSFLDLAPQVDPHWVLGNPPYAIPPPMKECPSCEGTGHKGKARRRCRKCKGAGTYQPRAVPVAEEHIRYALKLARPALGSVVYLLRSAIAESAERIPFWEAFPARHEWKLAERPSFDGQGTDSCMYSVFWWDWEWLEAGNRNGNGTWEVLSWDA